MILTGKNIRVLLGVITVFLHIPFTRAEKRKLSRPEEDCLDKLFDDVISAAEDEYEKIGASAEDTIEYAVKVIKRLTVSLTREFSAEELRLATEAVTACIAEFGEDDSINVYFGGYDYGLVPADYKKLLELLKAEKASAQA